MGKKKETKEKKIKEIEDIPGVGPNTVERLNEGGYYDLMSIAVSTTSQLGETAGVTEAAARKMINTARDSMKMGFEDGLQAQKKRDKVIRISIGSKNFDDLLGGGVETGTITECYGEFGSGKTQLGHLLTVNALRDNPDAMTVYIDTENTFRPVRIRQFAKAAGMDEEETLKRILVAKVFNSDHQMALTDKVGALITEEKKNIVLIVVDSLTAHFRAEFIGRGTLADRQGKLNRHMHTLLRVACGHNVCIYVTNQVMSRPNVSYGDPTAPIGGHIVGHNSATRIYLRKGKKGSRVAKLVDSSSLPDGEVVFEVKEEGIVDV